MVTIGLRDEVSANGYTPARQAASARAFRDRYGMPVAASPRSRSAATGRACRAVVATRLAHPGREFAAQRALAFAWFNTPLLLDEDDGDRRGARGRRRPGCRRRRRRARLGRASRRPTRATARAPAAPPAGPTEFQGKAAVSDGLVRYTAPSVLFETADGRRLEAGGFQPLEAYDVLIANLDTTLERFGPPEDPLALLEHFPDGLCTQEVAVLLAGNLVDVDRPGAEDALLAAGRGRARRARAARRRRDLARRLSRCRSRAPRRRDGQLTEGSSGMRASSA